VTATLVNLLERLADSGIEFVIIGGYAGVTAQELSFLQVPKPGMVVNNLYLRTDWGVVDILSSVLGLGDFHRLAERAEIVTIGGKACTLIAIEDLVIAKEAIGRDKDILAAKELRAIAVRRSERKKSAGGEAGAGNLQ
jgi:predicted nucleotidyltransferase